LFGRLNTLFCIPLGCGLWDACGEKSVQPKISFTTHRASNFDEHFGPAAATGTADHPHADVRPPSLPIFLLPLHSQCPPSLFFPQERPTRRVFPSHTRISAG
jgi:hypothetical protein